MPQQFFLGIAKYGGIFWQKIATGCCDCFLFQSLCSSQFWIQYKVTIVINEMDWLYEMSIGVCMGHTNSYRDIHRCSSGMFRSPAVMLRTCKQNQKSAYQPSGPSGWSVSQLLYSPGWNASPHRVTPIINFWGSIYTPAAGWREAP